MSYFLKNKKILVLILTSILFYMVAAIPNSYAKTAKDMYFEAETAYKKLRNNSQKQKYRSNWFDCIKKYQAVYEYDPKGQWAAAGLYMTGTLYWELYQHSYLDADKKEAEDIFHRIVNHFPSSRYYKKAQNFLVQLGSTTESAEKTVPQKTTSDPDAESKFNNARASYQKLLNNRSKQKYRDQWLSCIREFEAVYNHDPQGPWAAAGLYMTGVLYEGLSGYSFSSQDRQKTLSIYNQVVQDYPDSRYKAKAQGNRSNFAAKYGIPVTAENTASRYASSPKETANPVNSITVSSNSVGPSDNHRTVIKGIRYWSNPSYTRVVVDADGAVNFDAPHLLDENPSLNKPQRLYFDIHNSRLDPNLNKYVSIDDNLLSSVRAAQNTLDSARVVIDIKSFKTYKIFPLAEPSRIVVDVWGAEGMTQAGASQFTPSGSEEKLSPGALAKQLALGVRRIVIDAGHGGKDPGALGYVKNVFEKDITLDIARRLADKIKADLGCEVILTRSSDRSISLEERTAFANTRNADLFISVHVNAHRNRNSYGLETYYLNLATDDESIRVAARENATSEKNISDLHSILSDLMQNAKINESSRLASYVQTSMYQHMKSHYGHIKDNGVKKAPFYVLLGAQMPAILVETSFISNERECKRLVSPTYQNHLCDAIVKGVRNYIKETSPNTLSRN